MFGLSKLFSKKNSISETVDAVGGAFDDLFTSDEERMKAQGVLDKLKMQPHIMQAMANKIAAGHTNWFVAGGRPFILWVCGLNLLQMGVGATWFKITPPEWYVDMTTTITLGVLGLYGSMRTYEKVKGKSQ
jgi:hypothetical protein